MAATEAGTHAARALDDLYRGHAAEVYRYAYAVLGNAADAEDVTQTTFMNALRALERGETPREPSHWLLAIAHNLVRQRFRQQARRPSQVELRHEHDSAVATAESDPSLDDLVRALQQIPPAQREALVMRELEGRSYAEMAAILGISGSALETLLFRARRSLTDELENLVTCNGAELALTRQHDGRLSRKERRRLEAHVKDCPRCSRLAATRAAQGRAWKGLALLPLPISFTLLKGAPTASAAVSLTPVAPLGGATTAIGAGAATGGSVAAGGSVAGGVTVGAVAAKVAAVVVAVTVVGGVGYEGVQLVQDLSPAPAPAPAGGAGPRAKVVPPAVVTAASPRANTSRSGGNGVAPVRAPRAAPSSARVDDAEALLATPERGSPGVRGTGTVGDGDAPEVPAGQDTGPKTAPQSPVDADETPPRGAPRASPSAGSSSSAKDHEAGQGSPEETPATSEQGTTQSAEAPGQVKKVTPTPESVKNPASAIGKGEIKEPSTVDDSTHPTDIAVNGKGKDYASEPSTAESAPTVDEAASAATTQAKQALQPATKTTSSRATK